MSSSSRPAAWRLLFLAAAPLIVLGTLRHPRVPGMAGMMAHPDWVPSHVIILAGYAAVLGGLLLLRRSQGGGAMTRWLRLAIVGTALQVVEAVFHAAAVVDLHRLTAGHATPVLSTHLVLTALFYPLFSLSMLGLIVAGARERSLGSWWIAPLGMLGVIVHATAAILVVVVGMTGVGVLFAGIGLFGIWLLLAALWRTRRTTGVPDVPPAPVATRSVPAMR